MLKLSPLLILIIASNFIHAQTLNFEWANAVGADSADVSRDIAVDSMGNIYSTGNFKGTVDFDPGTSTHNLTSGGDEDFFIQKLDGNGDFVWAKSVGGAFRDNARSIALDASGSVYITGFFDGMVDFDPGAGSHNLTTNGNDDVFILKLDDLGDFVWAKSVGSASRERSYSIALDHSGNVYTTGKFVDTVDFDPGAGVANLNSLGGEDAFVLKLNSTGSFVWVKSFAGSLHIGGQSVSTDASGNVYVGGDFEGISDFDPGANIVNLTSNGSWDVFIVKLNSAGDYSWAKSFGGADRDGINNITIDHSGNVYTTGKFNNTVDFDPGAGSHPLISNGDYDIFVQKLHASGNFVWAKSFGSAQYDQGEAIATSTSGDCYLTGSYQGTVDFDPGTENFNLTSNGAEDIFILKLDAAGDFVYAHSIGGSMSDVGFSIISDATENLYLTGYFQSSADFDIGSSAANLSSNGVQDLFVAKYGPVISSIEENNHLNYTSVFPNPNQGSVNVDLGILTDVHISVYNLRGQRIYQKENINTTSHQFDLNVPKGIYFMELSTAGVQYHFKLAMQ